MVRHPGSHSAEFYRNKAILLGEASPESRCYFCGHHGIYWQINHIIQRRHGGTDAIHNLVLAHGHDDSSGRSGTDFRCPTCHVSCNQAYRNREPEPESYRSREW